MNKNIIRLLLVVLLASLSGVARADTKVSALTSGVIALPTDAAHFARTGSPNTDVGLTVALLNTAIDPTSLASESLTNGNLTSGTSWTASTDCALTANAATCTKSAGTASTISQASGTLAIAGSANRWYVFTYTISALTGTPTASITAAFASASTGLTMTAGAHTTYFKAAASPGNFTITTTLTGTQSFTIDTLSLKQITGGNMAAMGKFTGGGTSGLAIDGSGNATFDGTVTTGRNKISILGTSTGVTTLDSANAGGSNYSLILPAESDTLVDLSGIQTLTNKTFIAPALGTPASGDMHLTTHIPTLMAPGFNNSATPTVAQQGAYWVAPCSGALTGWDIVVDAGTATVKVWRIATGTAAPTNANSINTSGVSISTGTAIHSTTLTDFGANTTFTAGDIFGYENTAVSGVTREDFQLEYKCN